MRRLRRLGFEHQPEGIGGEQLMGSEGERLPDLDYSIQNQGLKVRHTRPSLPLLLQTCSINCQLLMLYRRTSLIVVQQMHMEYLRQRSSRGLAPMEPQDVSSDDDDMCP